MGQIFNVVKRNPVLTQRIAGQNLTAGLAVYLTDAMTVRATADQNCGGYAFDGVTVTTNSSGQYVTVASEPSEVYVNATGDISAGKYVSPRPGGMVGNATHSPHTNAAYVICGRALETGTAGSPVLIKLMNFPNASRIGNTS